jgi:Tfp pilus assembly protein PilF
MLFTKIMRPLCAVLACMLASALCGCSKSTAPAVDTRAETDTVTFNRDVAPIVFANCACCHHPGEAAPFSLLTYDDVRRRAGQIADVTRRRFMPPWLPVQGGHEFANARRLSDEQLDTIRKWAKGGGVEGAAADLPAAPVFVNGWQLGEPDLVLESPAYQLAATGADQFRNFVIPIEVKTPQWVESIELRPTNPRATHHARLGVDRTMESMRRDAADPRPGYEGMAWGQDPDGQLVTWVPGMLPHRGAPGTAWRLYPKTSLVLHTHMQTTGKPETVQFQIGVHFAKEPPTVRPAILRVGSREIDIPAGDPHCVVSDEYVVPVDLDVRSIFPHAHSLCGQMKVDAALPDGSTRSLVEIKDFDEKWHDDYRFAEPVRLPKGTRIRTEFAYDNTDANIRNRHHPPVRVVYGSNITDEMQDVYLQVTAVHPDERAAFMEDLEQTDLRSQLVGLRKTLEMNPQDPWSLEGLAACNLSLGKPKEAIRLFEERMKLPDDATYAKVSLGAAYLADGNAPRAEQLVREVLAKDSAYPLAWLGLGKALDARKQPTEAEKAYQKAVELAPALTDARLAWADNLAKQNKLDAAAAVAAEAIQYSPDKPNAFLKVAEILAHQRKYEDCLKNLEEARRLAPYTHPPKVLLSVYCYQNGDADKSKTLLREAKSEEPTHPVPELFLGQFAAREQRWNDARQFLEASASKRIPANWPESHKKRFMILLETERFKLAQHFQDEQLARSAVSEWIKYDPDNAQLKQIYNSLNSLAQ